MADPKNDFTHVTNLGVEALGEPGKRTFRVRVESASSSAVLWLEKAQLFELAMAIQRLLATLPDPQEPPGEPPHAREAPPLTSLDFKVDHLTLGHDPRSGLFVIDAHDAAEEGEAAATVRVWTSRPSMKEFADQALGVCAAGRPLCTLCGHPVDADGHLCVRLNGHRSTGGL